MMAEIKLKVETPGTCRGCLSSNRTVTSVRQHTSCDLYYSLLTKDQKLEVLLLPDIALCWECKALLHKTRRFQEQVQRAHTILQDSLQDGPPTLSSLTFHRKLDYDAILEENQPYEVPLFNKKQKTSTDNALSVNAKVITPRKFKPTTTQPNVDKVKNIKDVINDLLSKVKIEKKTPVEQKEHPSDNRYDKECNFSLSKEISEDGGESNSNQKVMERNHYDSPFSYNDSEGTDNEGKRKRKRQNKSEIVLDFHKEDNENYYIGDGPLKKDRKKKTNEQSYTDPNFNIEDKDVTRIRKRQHTSTQYARSLKKKVTKQIETDDDVKLSGSDSEGVKKRKREKKAEIDLDFDVEEDEHYDTNDSEYKKDRRKKTNDDTDPDFNTEDKDATKIKRRERTFRKTITYYKDISELASYFTEIEMCKEDIKITLEKDDAIVDELLKKKPYKCTLCAMMFTQSHALTYHAKRLHKAKYPKQMQKGSWVNPPLDFSQNTVWQCHVCNRMMRAEHVVAHMNEYHRVQYFCNGDGCEWCERPFWVKPDLDEHWEEIHKQFKCDYCNKRKKKKIHLETHIQDAHASRVKYIDNQCKICMRVLSSINALKTHHAIHEDKVEPPEQRYCVECNRTFKRIRAFEHHIRYRHTAKHKPTKYPCEICGKVLANKITLRYHVDLMHKGKTPFYCHICGKYLSKKGSLKEHLDSHNNVKLPKNKPCTVCGRMFQTNRILRTHIYTHTGERPFSCPHCDAAFTQPHCLRVHLAKQHHVDASVRWNGTIVEGSKTESNYLSKQCALNRHFDSHHKKVKPPKTKPCPVCGHMFQDNRMLRHHMYTHTGECPYKCPRCDAAFTQPHCLRGHLAKQHRVDATVRENGTIEERVNSS